MKKIAIIPNDTKDSNFANTKKIIEFLKDKANIFMDSKYSDMKLPVNYISYEGLFEKAEYMIVLGGDGTILQIAAECAEKDIPVMGINLGRVGFLTEIEPEAATEAMTRLLNGDFDIEKRMLMCVDIIKSNGEHICSHALNDVVVSKNAGSKLIKMGLYTNGEEVNKYISDGIIIATPTGSTGYSVSAGGPVVDPGMELYIATPVCAHTLSVRSAILPSDKELVIKLDKEYLNNEAVVSSDGNIQSVITTDDEVHITKSNYSFSIIKIGNYSFYDTVLKKLS